MDPIPKTWVDPSPDELSNQLDAIAAVEGYPLNEAFEQVMFDNLLSRQCTHYANEPIIITRELFTNNFPADLSDLFLGESGEIAIEDLRIAQLTDGDFSSEVAIKFNSNNRAFKFYTDDERLMFEGESASGDQLDSSYDRSLASSLIASLVYIRQHTNDPSAETTLRRDPLIARFDQEAGFIEQMILTLGDLDGESSVETAAAFDTSEGAILAKLTQIENPRLSGVNNSVNLGRLAHGAGISTELDQRGVNTVDQNQPYLAIQNAKISLSPLDSSRVKHTHLVVPAEEPEAWGAICQEFHEAINPKIQFYESINQTY